MACVYVVYSDSIDNYYVGSCLDLEQRIKEHNMHVYKTGFTRRATDWRLYFKLADLPYAVARKIEQHIERVKSRVYIENLKKYPAISEKLILKYS